MTVFSVVAIIIAGIMPKVWIKQSARVGRKLVDANLSMSEFLVGRLRSPSLVRLSGTELAEKKELSRLTLVQRKQVVINSILQSKTEVVMEPIIIALSLVFLYVAYSVLQLQIEVIGLYLVIVMRLMPVAKSVVKQAQVIQSSLGSIEALEGRFKEMNKAFEKNNGNKVLKEVKNSILIDNVSFHYPNDKSNALNDITVEFKPNTMIAIVGPSGGGKSTLIDLLPRLRMPSKGSIQIDGENIEGYTLESLRKLIAYVPQLPQIFNGTIRDHILYGKNDATEDEIERALYFSGAKEFVDRLPKGLDTLLGEDAVKVSGGQRQRLDLARALVKNAEILIMDEPTSNLDVESEERFNDVLTQIRKKTKTTIIIISHRLSSVVDSDQIIVLNQSRIEAIGTHNDLLKQKGWYAKAWNVQK
jgi:ABC-type multidrug transport system fused ATPase/permease subunit